MKIIIIFFTLLSVSIAQFNPVGDSTKLLLRSDIISLPNWPDQSIPAYDLDDVANTATIINDEVAFNGSSNFIREFHEELYFGTGDFTMSIRFKTNGGTNRYLASVGHQSDVALWVFGHGASETSMHFIVNNVVLASSAINSTEYFVVTIQRNGNVGNIWINGANKVTNATYFSGIDLSGGSFEFTLGGRSNGASRFWDGRITDLKVDFDVQTETQVLGYANYANGGRPSGITKLEYNTHNNLLGLNK